MRDLVHKVAVTLPALLLAFGHARSYAQDIPPVEYFTNSPLLVGSEDPTLIVSSGELVEGATLTLSRGSTEVDRTLGRLAPGRPAEITFESPIGTHRWRAELSGTWRDQPFSLAFEFDFELSEGLEISVPLDEVDLEQRRLTLLVDRPADHVDYVVMRDDGVTMGEGTVSYSGAEAGTPLEVQWEQQDGEVMKITLTVHDTSGFWAEVALIPWSLHIPHEEVHFATGSDVIEAVEEHKVDDAYAQLQEAVQRYGDLVDINLYVAGYTDTVGSRSDNQALSERRARSIARAFRQRGFRFPVYYQGFGEDALSVSTPDDTDEIRNRRALYILAAQPPLPSTQVPRSAWRQID